MKKFIIVIVILIIIDLLIVIIGSQVAHNASLDSNYIGRIDHVYFDNSSEVELTESNLRNIWPIIHRGAPGPFLFMDKFLTRRIEILEIGPVDRLDESCGSVVARVYTFFNVLRSNYQYNVFCP
jgi:hypothetical protein